MRMNLHFVLIAIWSPIAITSGEVETLVSSLTSTGRLHTCTNEPLTFLCEVEGPYLQWVYNSVHRSILFADERVDTVRTVTGQDVKVILTKNNEIVGSESRRRLGSALFISQSSPLTDSYNISCSSDEDMQMQYFREAERPNQPNGLIMNYFVQFTSSEKTVYTLSVGWTEPDNIDRFDLEYYLVQATFLESNITNIINGTTTEQVYLFDFGSTKEVAIRVTAISKCGDYGHTSEVKIVKPENSAAQIPSSIVDDPPLSNGSKTTHPSQEIAAVLQACFALLSVKSL